MPRRLRSPLVLPVIVALVLTAGVLASRDRGHLQKLELATYDLMVATLTPPRREPADVTLLVIDEADIQALGNWPLSDHQLHQALHRLLAHGPSVVGLDIYRDLPIPPGSDQLSEILAEDPRLVAIERFPGAGSDGVAPPQALRGSDRVGFADLASDSGGVIRRSLLFQSDSERFAYALAARLAFAHLARSGITPMPDPERPDHLRLGKATLAPLEGQEGGYVDADTGGYQIMLAYAGNDAVFPRHALRELLAGAIEPAVIRDRVVILGVSSESVKDEFVTPFAILGSRAGNQPGASIHAHATQQLIDLAAGRRELLRAWSQPLESAWIASWIALGVLAGWFAWSAPRLALVLSAGTAGALVAGAIAYKLDWWIPIVPNVLGWWLAAALGTAILAGRRRSEQRILMGLFAQHVAPEVAETIWTRRDEILDGGKVRPRTLTVTTLFADLQGFTRVSDRADPVAFLDWLNSYLGTLTETVMAHGGVLDDYAGDGIKANFGVPVHDPDMVADDARRAVSCALSMAQALTALNHDWQSRGGAHVGMRIGIHTGQVVVGTVGSKTRMKYTTVGRHVNVAARLEGLAGVPAPDPDDDRCNCRILISATTAALVAGHFGLRRMGEFTVKGISEPVEVFSVDPNPL